MAHGRRPQPPPDREQAEPPTTGHQSQKGFSCAPPAHIQRKLAPSGLQAVDFAAAMSARETLFWRVFFEHLLASCKSAADSAAQFQRWVTESREDGALCVCVCVWVGEGGWASSRPSCPPPSGTATQCTKPLLPAFWPCPTPAPAPCLSAPSQHLRAARAQAAAHCPESLPAAQRGPLACGQGAWGGRPDCRAAGRASAAAAGCGKGAGGRRMTGQAPGSSSRSCCVKACR